MTPTTTHHRSHRFHFIALFILLIPIQSAFAQWEFGFGPIGSARVDRFKESVYKPGFGMFTNLTSASLLGKNNPMKLQFGLYLDIQQHGMESFDITLTDPMGEPGKVEFTNRTTAQHFLLRYGYELNKLTVFTDLIVGHRKFYSETTTGLKNFSEEYEDDVQRIHSFNTYRHGIGFGMRYSFGRSFGMEVRADYTRGNKVRYFDLNKIEKVDDQIDYVNETWAYSDLFVGTLSLNWKLYRPHSSNSGASNNPNTKTKDDYYDNYEKSKTNSSTSPSYRTSGSSSGSTTRTKSTTKKKTPAKKKVSSSTKVKEKEKKEEKEKEKEINW